MVIRAGVLSDTHLPRMSRRFRNQIQRCFQDCEVIIHAGDLTDASVMDAFAGKAVYAVHGNCCGRSSRMTFPRQLFFRLGAFHIGLIHGDALGPDSDAALWHLFPEADCIICGHTHTPRCERFGPMLFLNPGAFQENSPYGRPGTYAILELGAEPHAHLFEIP